MLQTWRIYSCTHYKRIVLISNAHKLVTPNYLKTTNGWRFKSVWLLRECLKFYQFRHLPRSSKWLQQFCSQMTLNLIYFQIYPQLSILNEKGVFFLLRDSNLLGHLCAIRRYLFFGDQEFSHNLCSSLFFEMTLHPNTKWGPGNKSNAFSLSKRILNNFDSENTHHRGGEYFCTADLLFILFGCSSFAYVELASSIACVVKPKPVKEEVSHTGILPPMVSLLCSIPSNICIQHSDKSNG